MSIYIGIWDLNLPSVENNGLNATLELDGLIFRAPDTKGVIIHATILCLISFFEHMSSYPDVFEIRIFICFTKYLLVTIKWILFDIVQI